MQRERPGVPGKRIGADPDLRAELAICEKLGISHSHFLGGPARWTDLDRTKALDYARWKADVCDGCGTHEDWWDPEKGGSRFAFTPGGRRCPGCELLEQERAQIPKDAKGIHVHLVLNTDAEMVEAGRHVR